MKKLLVYVCALVALTFPAISSACHVTAVIGDANCNGWNLCTTVYFTSSVDQGSLEYTVTILDGAGEEITSFGETLTITHEPGAGDYEFCFEGIWEGQYEVSEATVLITSALDGQNPTTFEFELECLVDDGATVFGGLKAIYK